MKSNCKTLCINNTQNNVLVIFEANDPSDILYWTDCCGDIYEAEEEILELMEKNKF